MLRCTYTSLSPTLCVANCAAVVEDEPEDLEMTTVMHDPGTYMSFCAFSTPHQNSMGFSRKHSASHGRACSASEGRTNSGSMQSYRSTDFSPSGKYWDSFGRVRSGIDSRIDHY